MKTMKTMKTITTPTAARTELQDWTYLECCWEIAEAWRVWNDETTTLHRYYFFCAMVG